MSVAAPKSQAAEPIQLDIILVCRKAGQAPKAPDTVKAVKTARAKLVRLEEAGFKLSKNDRKIVLFGQLLTTMRSAAEADGIAAKVERQMKILADETRTLFDAG
jgi:putative DNA methylase